MLTRILTFLGLKRTVSVADFHLSNSEKGAQAFEDGNRHLLNKEFDMAVGFYDIAIRYFVKEAFSQRAICLQGLEYHFEALDDFDISTTLLPSDCNVYFMRAWSRIAVGDNAGAISDIHESIRLSKIDNEMNRVYNAHAIQSGWASIEELYASNILGIEQLAHLNTLKMEMNKPLNIKRRPLG